MPTDKDKFEEMWDQQEAFMKLLQEERSFPEFPVDISTKEGQKFLKGITHECQHELFEANQLLKNSKDHRQKDIKQFNEEAYLEELVDSMHYLFEIIIASGISKERVYDSYMKKGKKNIRRIKNGY